MSHFQNSGEETSGGQSGNHGRKRLPVGHVRALLSRAKVTVQEARSLHGFASSIIDVVAAGHPLGSKRSLPKGKGRLEEDRPSEALDK